MRRSLFVSDAERSKFLNALVTGTRDILRSRQGLAEHANYHEFCRLLGRLKTNYQLSELVRGAHTAVSQAEPGCTCLSAQHLAAVSCWGEWSSPSAHKAATTRGGMCCRRGAR